MNGASNVAQVLLNRYKYHHVETLFIFRLLASSIPRSSALLHGRRCSSVRFLIPWANSLHQSFMTHLIILLDTIQKDRHKFKEWGSQKSDMNLYFESGRDILRKQLTAKSFIADIRTGSKYPIDERNKLFSFQIKATLKATTLGICMCTTELLLWKNRKSSTCYPISLFKRDSTADIFLQIFNFSWTSCFKKQLQTTDFNGFSFAQNVK